MLIELSAGDASARVSTVGSTLVSWEPHSGASAVVGYQEESEIRTSTSYRSGILAPWSNRIAGGAWRDGEVLRSSALANARLEPGEPDDRAIHGLVAHADFAIFDEPGRLADRCAMRCTVPASDVYPAALTVTARWRLGSDGTLHLRLEVSHDGDHPLPIVLGWHPYFRVTGLADAALVVERANPVLVDEHLIPRPGKDAYGEAVEGRISLTPSDDYSLACIPAVDGRQAVRVMTGAGEVRIAMESPRPEAALFHVYTGQVATGGGLAVEACTAMADAFNRVDVRPQITFEPGEACILDVELHFTAHSAE